MNDWTISGGSVLRDGMLAEGDLHLAAGIVAEQGASGARRLDATGLLVLPGIVDIHGDAQERQLQPRPGIGIPTALALRDSDDPALGPLRLSRCGRGARRRGGWCRRLPGGRRRGRGRSGDRSGQHFAARSTEGGVRLVLVAALWTRAHTRAPCWWRPRSGRRSG